MNTVLRYLSYILFISAAFRVIPVVVALYYGESILLMAFSIIVTLIFGAAAYFVSGIGKPKPLTLQRAIIITALSFIILPLFSAVSFISHASPVDSIFESYSGFTTTGLTVFNNVDSLPRSMVFWRAEMQWIGGIGILIVFLFIFSRSKVHTYAVEEKDSASQTLYQSSGIPEKLEPTLRSTTRHALIIYCGYTLLGIASFVIAGLTFFDASTLAFSSISTGGFSTGSQFYENWIVLSITSLLMVAGAISFVAHNKLLSNDIKGFFSQLEVRLFIIALIAIVIAAASAWDGFFYSLFMLISALTTTGYSVMPMESVKPMIMLGMILAMIIGGTVGSTSGGIKLFRLNVLLESIRWVVKKLSSPQSAVIPFKVNKKPFELNHFFIIEAFVFSYFLIIIIGTAVLMIGGLTMFDSAFQMASALGTAGFQTVDISAMPVFSKAALIIGMVLGRLEIFPVFVFIRALVFREI